MSSTVAFRVMAHPLRSEWATEIAETVGAEIIWDEKHSPWDTHKRALLDGVASGASHVCVLQDDIILSDGLRESVEALVKYSGEHPVGLYVGEGVKATAALAYDPDPWWAGEGPIWGPGVVIPSVHVVELVTFGDRMRGPADDLRLWHFFRRKEIVCYYPNPSLVQHRQGHKSLVSHQRDRQAATFGSGVGKDWSKAPVILDRKALYPQVKVWKGNYHKVVRRHSKQWRDAKNQGWEERS